MGKIVTPYDRLKVARNSPSRRVLALPALVILAMLLQPLQSSAETDTNARYDVSATALAKRGAWAEHSHVVAQWLRRSPNSARAWYHEGLLLSALKRPGSIPAFERAVMLKPSSSIAWQALCVQLYKEGLLNESLVCSENIPLNEMREAFVALTFQHPILVGGVANWESSGGRKESAFAYAQPLQEPSRTNPRTVEEAQAQNEMARREAKELANLVGLRDRCNALNIAAQSGSPDASANVVAKGVRAMAELPLATAAFRVCAQYDQALKERQYYEVLRSQPQ